MMAAWAIMVCACGAYGATLRIVSYNIDCSDESSDNNITGSAHSLPTVVQAIGLHHLGTNAQQVDVMSCEELQSTTLGNFVTQLNNIYGAGAYAYDATTDLSIGGGTDGLIYNTHTIQDVSGRCLPTGQKVLLQSNGTYTSAYSPGGGTNGADRGPLLIHLRPIGFGTNDDFYMYVSHARDGTDDAEGDARYAEAQEVRSDAKYNLPAGVHILYCGDWNLVNGSGENAYKCLTGQTTSDGINWADNSPVWANTNQTQGYDPTSKTSPPTTLTWANDSGDDAIYLYSEETYNLHERIDIQLPNVLMFGAYSSQGGVQIAPDTSDPFDTSDFPSSKYPYAFEVFGNNGTTPENGISTNADNHSLDDLANTVPDAATVYYDLDELGTNTTFTGSDHYPIVGDYNMVSGSNAFAPGAFTAGNLVVERLGDGAETLSVTGNTIFLQEYTTTGTLIQTITIPDGNAYPGSPAMIEAGTGTTTGGMTLSPNGQTLAFPGYATTQPYSSAVQLSLSSVVPRAIGRMTGSGISSYAQITSTVAFSASNIRGAVADGENNFWAAGTAGTTTVNSGVYYFGTASSAADVNTGAGVGSGDFRGLNIFNGQLWFTTASGTKGIYNFPGLPTTLTSPTLIIAFSANDSDYNFCVSPYGNIIYDADNGGFSTNYAGIGKWTGSGASWTKQYILLGNANGSGNGLGCFGLTVTNWPSSETTGAILFATTVTASGNGLITVTDTGSSATQTLLASCAAEEYFRGVQFAPTNAAPGAPTLTITLSGNSAIVSWQDTGSFTLQQNSNLAVPAGWATSGYTVTTNNPSGTNSITLTPPAGSLFFRLANP
jgi:hypothetical protein